MNGVKVYGIQKLTLLDFPEKLACTLFTPGCDFRCPFCHNASLVTHIEGAEITEDELMSFLKKRLGVLEGVCVTGGEPLMQKGISELFRKIKALGYSTKLDTNGSFPDELIELVNEKLVDYIAMDIKNSPENYGRTIGLDNYNMDNIYKSVDFLMSGKIPFEFRTTVVKELHKESDFESIGKWLCGDEKYFLQTFKDSGDVIEKGLSAYSEEQMNVFCAILKKYVKNASVR